ncbi:MAG: transcription repressor NadR [Selenomonadaceae bacterium]|nr:transcription repressor NadR [Selenomonadaceae bacterium]
MHTEERRHLLLARLKQAKQPLTGTKLARELRVSRQIIVGDISILRAEGTQIFATPRGYILPDAAETAMMATLVCRHDASGMEKELQAVVDNGGSILDVIVEHPVYGPIRGDLLIESRRDISRFLTKMKKCQANPLLVVTGGIHMHTVRVPDEETLSAIRHDLKDLGILVTDDEEQQSRK